MGYLAMKDTGSVKITTESGVFTSSIASPDGTLNPGGDYNLLNLKPFSLSFNTGNNMDTKSGIAGRSTRVSKGSKKPIPFSMEAMYNRKEFVDSSNKITDRDINSISYLMSWSRSRTIIMLFWMPNDNDSSLLRFGQEPDFFTSQLRSLYDSLWDFNTSSSTAGYQSTTYGTYHYSVAMGGSIGGYSPCAIPVVIENVDVKEVADSYQVRVSVSGYVLENEQQESQI